jgi:hypothetical protein
MLPNWTVASNTDLGTFSERNNVSINLPLANTSGVTTTVISGALPGGLRLENNIITGTPFEVVKNKTSTFVIRASTVEGILDRTFTITVEGPDNPVFITPEGRLPIGPNEVYFILDSSIIDFQILATDNDLPAGDVLEYFIKDGNGELPPGITLTSTGKLTGVVDPLLALDINAQEGGYDVGEFSKYPFDFGIPSGSGIDTFYYDTTGYDFSIPTRVPRKLNRLYEFIVTVTDKVTSVDRRFQIYIVGDDFARADNTLMSASSGVYVADMTYLRNPIWLTPANLGIRRANNFITVYLDTLDQNTTAGKIIYTLEPINDDNSFSILPPGLTLDQLTGELAGIVPYQPAVTKEYKFTVSATRFNAEQGIVTVFGTSIADILSGNTQFRIGKLPTGTQDDIDDVAALIGQEVAIENRYYKIVNIDTTNEDYDVVTLDSILQPVIGKASLSIERTAPGGQDYFFINTMAEGDKSFYSNKTLKFSESAQHFINEIFPYIEWNISIEDSTGSIELNEGITGSTGGPSIAGILENFLGSSSRPAYVTSTSGISGIIELNLLIPATALTRQASYIKSLFHTSDSSAIFAERITEVDRVDLDSNLVNSLFTGRQISLGVIAGSFFSKSFPRTELDVVSAKKTFTLNLLGEVDSTITWLTDSSLSSLKANRPSTLFVRAKSSVPDAVIKYNIVSGSLPPGMALKDSGELVGKVPYYGTLTSLGLTFFDGGAMTLDGGSTTVDRKYTFTVLARDRFGFSATTRVFTLVINDDDEVSYSNIFVKPMLKQSQRSLFIDFINNTSIIPQNILYRSNDPEFGIQRNLKALVYAGIETKNISTFVSNTVKNHKKKRFTLGGVNIATAKQEGTNIQIYDVIYVEVIDPAKPASGKTKLVFNNSNKGRKITIDSVKLETMNDQYPNITGDAWRFRPVSETITIDNTAVQASQSNDSRKYISNIDNMRDRIKAIGVNSKDFLPVWMRTPQGDSLADLDYVFAVPLVYTLPGYGETVKQNIINSGFNFNLLDYEIDRYIIDSTTGNSQEQYIIFANYQFNA